MGHKPQLMYHQATLDLINEQPLVSEEAVVALDHLQRKRNFILPASVRAWYSLQRAVTLLDKYSNADRAVDVEQLGGIDRYWSAGRWHEIDLFEKGLLPILSENQGVCTWAIQLGGTNDPNVLVSFDDMMPFAKWQPYADTFSIFVYTRIWDYQGILSDYLLYGWEPVLSPDELRFLRTHFIEGPQTFTYPAVFTYRFSKGSQRILLWEGEHHTDWWLSATSEEELLQLTKAVWLCGTLARSLEGYTCAGNVGYPSQNKQGKCCVENLARDVDKEEKIGVVVIISTLFWNGYSK